jgi:3-(3-hydroxy-phenyl)propionate hydroxylase
VLEGRAGPALLQSYNHERIQAADENILNSSRSTDFLTPKNAASRAFRDAALQLAQTFPFARAFVNSGRLSLPCILDDSPLNTPDIDRFTDRMCPGTPCIDAPVVVDGVSRWFLSLLDGQFTVLLFTEGSEQEVTLDDDIAPSGITIHQFVIRAAPAPGVVGDTQGLLARYYDATPGTVYLLRPDQHVAARWRTFDADRLRRAIRRAIADDDATQTRPGPAT